VLYSIRSERALMDQIDLHLGFRWFVGLSLNEEVWEASTSLSFTSIDVLSSIVV
jgi:transposase